MGQALLRNRTGQCSHHPALQAALRGLILEAIELEQAGNKIVRPQTQEAIPEELAHLFSTVPGLQASFEALTPGRRRAYLLHFNAAKQSKTRLSRIERCIAQILADKGLAD